jgi:hypothetical protein
VPVEGPPALGNRGKEPHVTDTAPTETPSELDGITIVVLGNFNPSIFSPAWFRLHNLIGAVEADEAKVQMIVPPAAVFATEWLSVQVLQDRMALATAMPQEFQRLRDTAVGILQILAQTPVNALGINWEHHWRAPDFDSYMEFGDVLAPKDVWSDLNIPGTQDLTVRSIRNDHWSGWIDVTVQPSVRVAPFGVYARVNDHTWLQQVERQPQSRVDFLDDTFRQPPPQPSSELIPTLLTILRDEWEEREAFARDVLQTIRETSGANRRR